jgi:hypothetical protein
MEKRSVQEIALDMKKSILRLLDATKRAEQADRDRTVAIVELLNLQKELQRMTDGSDAPDSHH